MVWKLEGLTCSSSLRLFNWCNYTAIHDGFRTGCECWLLTALDVLDVLVWCPLDVSFFLVATFLSCECIASKSSSKCIRWNLKANRAPANHGFIIFHHLPCFIALQTCFFPRRYRSPRDIAAGLHQADASAASPVEETLAQRHGGAWVADNDGWVSYVVYWHMLIDRARSDMGFLKCGYPNSWMAWPIMTIMENW